MVRVVLIWSHLVRALHVAEVLIVAKDLADVLAVLHLLLYPALRRGLQALGVVFVGIFVLFADFAKAIHGLAGQRELIETVHLIQIAASITH